MTKIAIAIVIFTIIYIILRLLAYAIDVIKRRFRKKKAYEKELERFIRRLGKENKDV